MTNINNGGRTPVAGIVHAVVLLVIFLVLMPLAAFIPMSCLAGVLVIVSYNMSGWRTFMQLMKNPKSDITVLLITFFLTVIFDLTVAIEVGLLIACLLFMRRMAESTQIKVIADTDWGELDYFVLDTPPGTSDIHLTLLQNLAITGAVIVSTPQQVALADARKGIDMYRNEKVNVPILGMVENMAWFTPAELPENKYYLFGREGVKHLAEEMDVPLLGQIPIVQSICESGDEGEPVAVKDDTMTALAFRQLAEAVVSETEKRNKELPATHIVEMTK